MGDMNPCNLQGFYRGNVFSSGSFSSFSKGPFWKVTHFFSFLLDEIVRPFVNYNKRELNFLCHLIISLGDQIVTSKIRK